MQHENSRPSQALNGRSVYKRKLAWFLPSNGGARVYTWNVFSHISCITPISKEVITLLFLDFLLLVYNFSFINCLYSILIWPVYTPIDMEIWKASSSKVCMFKIGRANLSYPSVWKEIMASETNQLPREIMASETNDSGFSSLLEWSEKCNGSQRCFLPIWLM